MTTYYHFARIDDDGLPRLGYRDGREIVVGETLTVAGPVVLCEHGLHASRHVLDALQYAPRRAALCLVELGGEIVHGGDKSAASERRCVAMLTEAETDALLRAFARWCALSVAHLWQTPMPDVVRAYLESGDESLRAAAWDAAWAAARDADAAAAAAAARAAAWDAAAKAVLAAVRAVAETDAVAALAATGAAAWVAASDAAAAAAKAAAARAAASDAARDAWDARATANAAQHARLDEMAQAAFAEQANSEAGINPEGENHD